ncbi:MAG TPA: energy transducer TonB [Bacteroidales bacterium]|nr:energy transducer TonB [Bacteroidales bacterium]
MILHRSLFLPLVVFFLLSGNLAAQYYEMKPAENFGGKSQLQEFIAEEMVYPDQALLNKQEGKVIVSCIVDRDGNVKNPVITRSVSPEIDREALRVFRSLLWEPANHRGLPVDSETVVEFDFKVKRYKRIIKKRGYDKIDYPFLPVDSTLKIYTLKQLNSSPQPVYRKEGMHFGNFVSENMVYPPAALKQDISGTVELFFIVEPSGRASNIKVMKSVGGGCNEEAIRLLKLLRWKPGIKDNMAVRTEMTLSLTFNLADYENLRYVPASNTNQF